jgi:hypothetical protein
MFCPACAHNNADAATTCAQCGGALPRPMQGPGMAPPPYPGPQYGMPPGAPYGAPPPGYGGAPMGGPYAAPYGQPYPYGPQGPYGAPMPIYRHQGPPIRTSGMAIAGFILSFFGGILGLVFSILGYNEAKNSGGAVGGQGLGLAGIIISIVMMVFWLFITVAVD